MAEDRSGITVATLQGRRNAAADAGEPNGQQVDDSPDGLAPNVALTQVTPGKAAVIRHAPKPGPQSQMAKPPSQRRK